MVNVVLGWAGLILLGIGYAFYVKPRLLQGKKEWAEGRRGTT
jgi:hypothetical protein